MVGGGFARIRSALEGLMRFPDHGESFGRYQQLRRNLIVLMVLVTLVPLFLMALINHYQYQKTMSLETIEPLRVRANDTRRSFEMFLTQRQSALSLIASTHRLEELREGRTLARNLTALKREIGGFVDLGVIDSQGLQVSYVGPYDLRGKSYADQHWFQEVAIRGTYVSDVFLGYRQFPHFVIAVRHLSPTDEWWVLRATIDTEKINQVVGAFEPAIHGDTFIVNRSGVLQTPSKFYGQPLEKLPMDLPPTSYEPAVVEMEDPEGREIFVAYTYIGSPAGVLMTVRPKAAILRSWYAVRSENIFLLLFSSVVICIVIFRISTGLVKRIEESEKKRELASHQMQYSSKLATIGRLAAGVAHEVNNPMAIINEKAGLMKDLIGLNPDFPEREKLLPLTESILESVSRCRTITHRLLGFARHMDVEMKPTDLNYVVREVVGFLEKEAFHRSIEVKLDLEEDLPMIASDEGQLQQVFLNILNNALDAVDEGGRVVIQSRTRDDDSMVISFEDNGSGMSAETLSHIFDPFFSTKKKYGTGLGLSITYGIVKQLGGTIEVDSEERVGTTFRVCLPRVAPAKVPSGTTT
jgi:two-component system NtrC family sensor kinase